MYAEESNAGSPADLRWYLAVLRRHKVAIILVTGLTVAATVAFTLQQTPLYSSSTRVLVKATGVSNYQYRPGDLDMNTEAGIAGSEVVAGVVKDESSGSKSIDELLSGLEVTAVEDTAFLDFKYTDADPRTAQELANGFAHAYITNRNDKASTDLEAQIKPLEAELRQLNESIPRLTKQIQHMKDPARIATLSGQLSYALGRAGYLRQQLLPFKQAAVDGGDVVSEAPLPSAPSSPSYPRNIAMALMAGLALGITVSLTRERLDDRLRGSRDLEERIGAPVLATIPMVESWKKRGRAVMTSVETPKGPIAEAYRTLRTNLQFIAKDDDFRVIAVTSALEGEGKTTTVANLAATLAQTGQRVIAVSCDLRKPRLHTFFGVPNEVGVTSILSSQTNFTVAALRPTGIDTLRIISSGPIPSNPAELLDSDAMRRLVAELRNYADFVLIDTPPVLAVTDTLVVSPYCDGVVIVADARTTSRAAAIHAREQLEQVGSNIVGCILNNFDPTQARYYPYANPYYYSSSHYYGHHKMDSPEEGSISEPNGHKSAIPSAEEMWRS